MQAGPQSFCRLQLHEKHREIDSYPYPVSDANLAPRNGVTEQDGPRAGIVAGWGPDCSHTAAAPRHTSSRTTESLVTSSQDPCSCAWTLPILLLYLDCTSEEQKHNTVWCFLGEENPIEFMLKADALS